jgi:hypothetical protein
VSGILAAACNAGASKVAAGRNALAANAQDGIILFKIRPLQKSRLDRNRFGALE